MKRALAFLLAVFCLLTMVACPAPTPDSGTTTTTTTTTTSSTSGNGGGQPTAPLTLTSNRGYFLVGDEISLSAGGTEGATVLFTAPDGSVSDEEAAGVSYTATAAAAGVHTFTVSDGTRVASCTVTVFPNERVTVPSTNELVRLLGRTETNTSGAVLLNNTASGFEVTFFGKSLSVVMSNAAGKSDTAKFAVYMDDEGNPAEDIIDLRTAGVEVEGGREITLCTFDEAGVHTVRLQKITQESLASAIFTSVIVEGGLLETEADEALRLLVYGDSITCGHSNMRPDGGADTMNSTNENGMLTYAMRVASLLNADAHVFSKSGLGLYTNPYSSKVFLKDIYGKVSPASNTDWDMTSWVPDVVVINIGTNDIWTTQSVNGNPSYTQDAYVDAYVDMVLAMVEVWGDQVSFFLCTSMMAANLDASVQAVYEELVVEHGIAAYYVDLPMASPASKHPDNATHAAAAAVLYNAILENVWIEG